MKELLDGFSVERLKFLADRLTTRIKSLEIHERAGTISSTQQETLDAFRIARDVMQAQPLVVELNEGVTDEVKAAFAKGMDRYSGAMLTLAAPKPIELTVWYGAMPESNGKTNWTAILHRKGEQVWDGITIDRSEYPDRVRYEADRMRYLIGELTEEPDILAYDADKHSGYVAPQRGPEGIQ